VTLHAHPRAHDHRRRNGTPVTPDIVQELYRRQRRASRPRNSNCRRRTPPGAGPTARSWSGSPRRPAGLSPSRCFAPTPSPLIDSPSTLSYPSGQECAFLSASLDPPGAHYGSPSPQPPPTPQNLGVPRRSACSR
jgi:hypothetical protein